MLEYIVNKGKMLAISLVASVAIVGCGMEDDITLYPGTTYGDVLKTNKCTLCGYLTDDEEWVLNPAKCPEGWSCGVEDKVINNLFLVQAPVCMPGKGIDYNCDISMD